MSYIARKRRNTLERLITKREQTVAEIERLRTAQAIFLADTLDAQEDGAVSVLLDPTSDLRAAEAMLPGLDAAIAEVQKRMQSAEANAKVAAYTNQVNETKKLLAKRDKTARELEATISTMATQYTRLLRETTEAFDASPAGVLQKMGLSNFFVTVGEIHRAVVHELFRTGTVYDNHHQRDKYRCLPGGNPPSMMLEGDTNSVKPLANVLSNASENVVRVLSEVRN